MEHHEPPQKRLQSKRFCCKFQRKQSSMEMFTKVIRGPRFRSEFLESSNDRSTRTTCHLNFPKVPQVFDYFVVIDFEATCDKDKNPHPQEIIEFPSIIVSGVTGQIEACFRTYVRPSHNQILTDFCKDLTGIQQDQVDSGVTLDEALLMHDEWLETNGIKNSNFAVVTWSNCDCQVMLESECKFKKIPKPAYFNRWINLQDTFHDVFGYVRCNLKKAVEIAGLEWEGRAHSGLDDAKNTARLVALIMLKGYKFFITNSLPWKPPSEEQAKVFPECHYKLKGVMITPVVQYHPYFHCGVMMNTPVVLFNRIF